VLAAVGLLVWRTVALTAVTVKDTVFDTTLHTTTSKLLLMIAAMFVCMSKLLM
jgi:putative copper export protein